MLGAFSLISWSVNDFHEKRTVTLNFLDPGAGAVTCNTRILNVTPTPTFST